MQLLEQPVHALLLIQVSIGLIWIEISAEFIQRVTVPRALLTDIEPRKREAVDVNLSEQGVEGLTGEISAHQACADQLKITAKFGDRPVMEGFARLTFGSKRLGALSRSSPSGIGQLIISQLGETQPFEHEAHL